MARQRAFDTAGVLTAARHVFSKYGYAGTSIDMLVQAMQLQRGSLYQAFGSKAGIFRACFLAAPFGDETKDLLVIALWERANIDAVVHAHCVELISRFEAQSRQPIAEILYDRLTQRANEIIKERT